MNEPRQFLIFFLDTPRRAWWANFLRPGFRHVCALAWYGDAERWVYFNPALDGANIAVFREDQQEEQIARLLARAAAVLRVTARRECLCAPPFAWCTGSIKHLLGVRLWAVTPWQLYGALVARGAEVVKPPCVVAPSEAAARSAHERCGPLWRRWRRSQRSARAQWLGCRTERH